MFHLIYHLVQAANWNDKPKKIVMAFSDKQSNKYHNVVALKLLIREIQLHFSDLLGLHVTFIHRLLAYCRFGVFLCVRLLSVVSEVDSMVLSFSMYWCLIPALAAAYVSGILSRVAQTQARVWEPIPKPAGKSFSCGSLNFAEVSYYSVLLINHHHQESWYRTVWTLLAFLSLAF